MIELIFLNETVQITNDLKINAQRKETKEIFKLLLNKILLVYGQFDEDFFYFAAKELQKIFEKGLIIKSVTS